MILNNYTVKMSQSIHYYPNEVSEKQYQITTYIVNGSNAYRFVGYSTPSNKESLKKMMSSLLDRLVLLTPSQSKAKGVSHLQLHKVVAGDTLAKLAKRYLPNQDDGVELFKSFNKLETNTLIIGHLIKIPVIQIDDES